MLSLLETMDWSAVSLKVRIAISALKYDRDSFADLLPKALASDGIRRENLLEWPVFHDWWGQEWFNQLVPPGAAPA